MNGPRVVSTVLFVAVVVVVAAGCSHEGEFIRYEPYPEAREIPALAAPVLLELDIAPTDQVEKARVIEEALKLCDYPTIRVLSAGQPGWRPHDYAIRVSVSRGGGPKIESFFIAWPGFIVFAPAWHGLMWDYEVLTKVAITDAEGRVVRELAIADPYEVRHTHIGYGIGCGFGWFLLYTTPALVTGIVAATASPELDYLDRRFTELEGRRYGDRIAAEILAAVTDAELKAGAGVRPR